MARTGTTLGLISLVDHLPDPTTGQRISPQQRLSEVVDQAVLAEDAGFERFALGEHHFSDYILSNPIPMLAAIAVRTRRIRLMTAVTLLACRDAVQTAEDAAIVDNLSAGRLELSFARGVSAEVSQAFGVEADRVYAIMEDKLDAVIAMLAGDPAGPAVRPAPVQRPHPPIWIGGGLSPESCDLAIARGLPLVLPSLFRYPEDYAPMLERYRDGMQRAGRGDAIRVALPSYCWLGETSQAARAAFRPRLLQYVDFAGSLRSSFGRPLDFDGLLAGPAICGSAAEVVDRISAINERLRLDHHLLLVDVGGVPYPELRDCIERLGRDVLPQLGAA